MSWVARIREWRRLGKVSCIDGGRKHEWRIHPDNPVYPNGLTGTPFGDLGYCVSCGSRTYLNEPSR